MDRFFYYMLGALATLLLALGVIGLVKGKQATQAAAVAAADAVTPTPKPPFVFNDGLAAAASTPAVIEMPTPFAPATPTPIPWTAPNVGQTLNLTYPGFTVVYSPALSSPLAVQYAMVGGAKPRRWPEPPKVRTPSPSLIPAAGYARGQMALQKSIALYFGKQAGRNTELMTNICAFNPPCLGGPWAQFDSLEARWAGEAGWIEVIAGPVFGSTPMQTQNGVVVPVAFYRAYRRSYGDTIAFLIPQTAASPDLANYITSIATIEAATGMSIFANTITLEQRTQQAAAVW